MEIFIAALIIIVYIFYLSNKKKAPDLSILPERFVIFDLETTGLRSESHEIIEIGAIRVNRDSKNHETFEILVMPRKKIPKKITEITGITQEFIEKQGVSIETALPQFLDFIGDLPLIAFNAEFDIGFLTNAITTVSPERPLRNRVICALKMARRAWPKRKSYRLVDLAKDGGLSSEGTHRALGDCKRTLIVYTSAASILGSVS